MKKKVDPLDKFYGPSGYYVKPKQIDLKPKYGDICLAYPNEITNASLNPESKEALDCGAAPYVIFTEDQWQKEAEELIERGKQEGLREGFATARKAYSDIMKPRRDFVIRDNDLSDCHFFEYPDFDSFLKSRK